jgi:hypothetical protein
MKVLIAGWFSFTDGHATAGDILTRDVACEWLQQAGFSYDIAVAPPFQAGVDWRSVDPRDYQYVLFVCGPFQNGELEQEFLSHFRGCRLIGLNLSMNIPLDTWNPWDFLIERDSSETAHPDIAFYSNQELVPVIGVCLVEAYEGATVMVEAANAAIDRLMSSRPVSVVEIDTRLDANSTRLRSPAEIEALIARMDVVVTTRLHGTVLALKNGVPVVAIDPEAGGAKIQRQASIIGWPVVFNVDTLTDEALQNALNYCLTDSARAKARECRERAIITIEDMRVEFITALTQPHQLEQRYRHRIRALEDCESSTLSDGNTTNNAAGESSPAALQVAKRIVDRAQILLKRVAKRA